MDKATRERLRAQAAATPIGNTQTTVTVPSRTFPPLRPLKRKVRTALEQSEEVKDATPKGNVVGEPCGPTVAGEDMGACCCCPQPIVKGQMTQQTKKLKWRHVKCPPSTPKLRPPRSPVQLDTDMRKKDRLPHGSAFSVRYDAATETWRGDLTIPEMTGFTDSADALFKLLTKLDSQYRAALTAAQANK